MQFTNVIEKRCIGNTKDVLNLLFRKYIDMKPFYLFLSW